MVIPSLTRKQGFYIALIVLAVLVALIVMVTRYISPSPPSKISMTTGSVDGASHQFALKYQAILKTNGVTLDLQTSSGAIQNLQRLNADTPAGFVQGGLGQLSLDTVEAEQDTPLRSLGVVGYEPVWLFTARGQAAKALRSGLAGLAGKKVAIGAQGSGTRKVALDLLQSYAVTPKNATLLPDGGMAAAQALIGNKIDALIAVSAPQAAAIELLLNHPDIELVAIEHAEGLTRRLPYLSLVVLKAGSVNPLKDVPAQDISLLTTSANLVVRDDLHPAAAYLLLEAAREVHKGATLLNKPGEFPHPRGTDFPLATEAQRYYKDGRPFLQRYLPYWLANALQRLLLILIPLVAIAFPVLKTIPSLLQFKARNRLFRRYEKLLKMERDIRSRQLSPAEIAQAMLKLQAIESDITSSKFPLDFADRIYTLRQHIDYVRVQLHKEQQGVKA